MIAGRRGGVLRLDVRGRNRLCYRAATGL